MNVVKVNRNLLMTLKWVKAPSKKFTNEGISYWPGSERMTINIQTACGVLCLWSRTHVASISKIEMIKHTLIMTHAYWHTEICSKPLPGCVSRVRCAGRRTPQTVWVRVYAGTCRQVLAGCQIKQRRTWSTTENLHGLPRNMFKRDMRRLTGTGTACRTFLLWTTQSSGRMSTTHNLENKNIFAMSCTAGRLKTRSKFWCFPSFCIGIANSFFQSTVKNGVESLGKQKY